MIQTSISICNTCGIRRPVAIRQVARLIKKWLYCGKKRLYLNEIKRLLKYEFFRLGKSYFCSKCKRIHYRGTIYEKHKENIDLIASIHH